MIQVAFIILISAKITCERHRKSEPSLWRVPGIPREPIGSASAKVTVRTERREMRQRKCVNRNESERQVQSVNQVDCEHH